MKNPVCVRVILAFLFFALPASAARGQNPSAAKRLQYFSSAPSTCNHLTGDVYIKTSVSPTEIYWCSAANTWTKVVGGSGGGSIAPLAIVDANTVEQRNGTNGQIFQTYLNYTSSGNYARMVVRPDTFGYAMQIITEGAGSPSNAGGNNIGLDLFGKRHLNVGATGSFAGMEFWANNAARWLISGNGGGFYPAAHKTYDIGDNGLRVRQVAATNISTGTQTVTAGAFMNPDFHTAGLVKVVLGAGTNTFYNVSNPVDGGIYRIAVIQDGTGGRTLTWGAIFAVNWAFTGGAAPTLTSTANSRDIFTFYYDASTNTMYETARAMDVRGI